MPGLALEIVDLSLCIFISSLPRPSSLCHLSYKDGWKRGIRQSWWRTQFIRWIKAGHSFTVSSSILGLAHKHTSYTLPWLTTTHTHWQTDRPWLTSVSLGLLFLSWEVWPGCYVFNKWSKRTPSLSEICSFTHFEAAKKEEKNKTKHRGRHTHP